MEIRFFVIFREELQILMVKDGKYFFLEKKYFQKQGNILGEKIPPLDWVPISLQPIIYAIVPS